MSEKAQEDLYFYNLYHGTIIEFREPVTSVPRNEDSENAKLGSLYEILNDQLQPDLRWHIDVCY